jgi:hypothetical protein
LATGIRDSSGQNFSFTGNNSLYISNTNSEGHAQGSTYPLQATGAGALYIAGADNDGYGLSTTDTSLGPNTNSVFVSLTDASGFGFGTLERPLEIDISAAPTLGILTFDIENGVTGEYVSLGPLRDHRVNLFNLNCYNDGIVPLWLKVYDISSGTDVNLRNGKIKLNVAVPPKATRDLPLTNGLTFKDGLHFRASPEHEYDSSGNVDSGVLYVNGSYI